jgi:hypothetical protein
MTAATPFDEVNRVLDEPTRRIRVRCGENLVGVYLQGSFVEGGLAAASSATPNAASAANVVPIPLPTRCNGRFLVSPHGRGPTDDGLNRSHIDEALRHTKAPQSDDLCPQRYARQHRPQGGASRVAAPACRAPRHCNRHQSMIEMVLKDRGKMTHADDIGAR